MRKHSLALNMQIVKKKKSSWLKGEANSDWTGGGGGVLNRWQIYQPSLFWICYMRGCTEINRAVFMLLLWPPNKCNFEMADSWFSQLTGVSMYFHPPEYNICSLTTVMKTLHVPAVWRVPYQAYGPFCSCSSPPGIASRSRSCRPWCCNCWRSPNPSAWPCSHPRAEAGMSAERYGGARAQPLRANCLLNIPSCVWRINAVIWPFFQHCEECINLSWGKADVIYLTWHWEEILTQHVHARYCCGASLLRFSHSYSPSDLSLRCPHVVVSAF